MSRFSFYVNLDKHCRFTEYFLSFPFYVYLSNIFKNHNFIGCLIYEVFFGLRLGKINELCNIGSIPKVNNFSFFYLFYFMTSYIEIKGYFSLLIAFMFYSFEKIIFHLYMLLFFCLVSASRLPTTIEFHALS